MEATNFNLECYGTVARGFPVAEASAPDGNEGALAPPCEGKRLASEAGPAEGPASKRQKAETTLADLPHLPIDAIFQFLGLRDKEAFSMTCRAFHKIAQRWYQQRSHELFGSEAVRQLFARFGISRPAEGASGHAQMADLVARTKSIIKSMQQAPGANPSLAERVVLQVPARALGDFLLRAYYYNLLSIFPSPPAPPTASTLEGVVKCIQDWLGTEEAKNLENKIAVGHALSCLPSEISLLRNLKRLVLSHNRFATLPGEIGQLTNLQELVLDDNELITVPGEIGWLANLQVLSLEHNRLVTLPAEIGRLARLQSLSLSHNRIGILPAEVWKLTNLQCLILDRNRFSSIPAAIGQLANLQQLHLNHNQLATLPAAIGQLPKLESLRLESNQFFAIPSAIWQFAKPTIGVPMFVNPPAPVGPAHHNVQHRCDVLTQELHEQGTMLQRMHGLLQYGQFMEQRTRGLLQQSRVTGGQLPLMLRQAMLQLNQAMLQRTHATIQQPGLANRFPIQVVLQQWLAMVQQPLATTLEQIQTALQQRLDTLQQTQIMLRQQIVGELQYQTAAEVVRIQQCLERKKDLVSSAAHSRQLRILEGFVVDFAQLTRVTAEMVGQLACPSAADLQAVRANLEEMRHGLLHNQGGLGSLYGQFAVEPPGPYVQLTAADLDERRKGYARLDLLRKIEVLALHQVQLGTAIDELMEQLTGRPNRPG